MVVRKITISLEESAYQAAVPAAKAAGLSLSAWLSRSAEHRARIEAGLSAVEAYEAAYAISPTRVDDLLGDLGVGIAVPPERHAQCAAALARLRAS